MFKLTETATQLLIDGTVQECGALVDAFKYKSKGYRYSKAYDRWVASGGKEGWDGFNRPIKRCGAFACKTLRGRRYDVLKWICDNGYEADIKGLLKSPFSHLTIDDIDPALIAGSYGLDERQRKTVFEWCRNGIGIAQVTVSGGKTATFAGAIALIKLYYPKWRVLYVTPSERLVKQSAKELAKMLPGYAVGQYGGGHKDKDAKDVVVCTIAILNKHFKELVEEGWFNTMIAVCYDECHHAASKSSMKILQQIPAFFRFGASDTTEKDDEERWNNIRGLFGPVVNVVTAAPLINEGRIAIPHIHVVDCPDWTNRYGTVPFKPRAGSRAFVLVDDQWKKGTYAGPVFSLDAEGNVVMRKVKTAQKDDNGEWIVEEEPVTVVGLHRIELDGVIQPIESKWCLLNRAYDQAVIQFKARNDSIVKWAAYYSNKGYPTVVVCTRTLHVYILEALLKRAIRPELVDILIGKDGPKQRDACFDWFRNTPGSVLVTPLVKEGVSINEIRAGVIADYVADWETANQIVGRFIRQKKTDNYAQITWFRERQHPVLLRGSKRVLTNLSRYADYGYRFYDPAPADPAELTQVQGELKLD